MAIKLANLYVMVPIAFVPPAALLSYLASPLQNEKTPYLTKATDHCLDYLSYHIIGLVFIPLGRTLQSCKF